MTKQLNRLLEKTRFSSYPIPSDFRKINHTSFIRIISLHTTISDWDKDERYMATNDLCSLLQNYSNNSKDEASSSVKMDENMEQRICAAILKQLGTFP